MDNYVGVAFSDYGKVYIYRVPDYIDMNDVEEERWVIVEDAFYNQDDLANGYPPYSFAKIIDIYYNDKIDVTKNIVCVVPGTKYKAHRHDFDKKKNLEEIQEMLKSCSNDELESMKSLIEIARTCYRM